MLEQLRILLDAARYRAKAAETDDLHDYDSCCALGKLVEKLEYAVLAAEDYEESVIK